MARSAELVVTPSTVLHAVVGGPVTALSVDIGLPASGAGILGAFVLGTSKLGGRAWYSVVDRWQGCSIDEGADDDNLTVGTMNISLDNNDGILSPWSPDFPNGGNLYAGPGTLIRVGFRSSAVFWSLFTGIVESWTVQPQALGQISTVQITAAQTMSVLARTNDLPLVAPVGASEGTPARMGRLLDAATWPFGVSTDSATSAAILHQATNQSANRLSELDVTARSRPDAAGVSAKSWRFFSDRRGQAFYGPPGAGTDIPGASATVELLESDDVDGDTLQPANDDDLLLNIVTLGVTGGATTTYTNDLSVGRQGYRSDQFTDFNSIDGTNFDPVADEFLAIGDITLRPSTFQLDGWNFPDIVKLAPWVPVDITTIDGVVFTGFRIAKMAHNLTPVGENQLHWTATVTVRPTAGSTVGLPAPDFLTDEFGELIVDETGDMLVGR